MRLLILLMTAISLGGCIEIVEEITINKDTGGTVVYRIESPGPGGMLGGLLSMVEPSIQRGVILEAEKLIGVLKSQNGISNIAYSLHGSFDTYYVRFDFEDCSSLNNALYAMGGARKTPLTPNYIKINNKRIKRFNFTPTLNRYLKKEGYPDPAPYLAENITFRSMVHTPDDIRKVKNASKKGSRTAIQRIKVSDILSGKADAGLRIRY